MMISVKGGHSSYTVFISLTIYIEYMYVDINLLLVLNNISIKLEINEQFLTTLDNVKDNSVRLL